MRLTAGLMWLILSAVAVGCIGLSCYFAFEFGWTRGNTPAMRWGFGLLAAGLDLAKSGILIITTGRAKVERRTAAAAFVFLTFLSLWCAGGMSATQLADRVTKQVVAATTQKSKENALAELKEQRKNLPTFTETTQEGVTAAETATTTAKSQRLVECGENNEKRGPRCKDREKDERDAVAAEAQARKDLGLTKKAADLDSKIETLRKDVEDPDRLTAANKATDPQAKAMSKAFGASEDAISLIGFIIFALSVELGSGVLPWLLFGHGGRREEMATIERTPTSTALVPVTPIPLVETPESVRQRFFDEVVLPWLGERVRGSIVYIAYARWCMERSLVPMTPHAFGLEPPWDKDKIGGNVWYLNCRLAEAYAEPQLRLAVSNG